MMIANDENDANPLDPLLNLPVPSPVTSLCFTASGENNNAEDSSHDESDSSGEIEFRSSRLQKQQGNDNKSFRNLRLLANRFLTSCHSDSTVRLWDLSRRESIAHLPLRGPGMAMKRTEAKHSIMCQTRDPKGTVSILDTHQLSIQQQFETYSQTFCQAAPCTGDENLLALPAEQDNIVRVMDRRDDVPVYTMPIKGHGMLTSLAMSIGGGSKRPILACGMESGSVIFHHLSEGHASTRAVHSLSKDPVLALDLHPSQSIDASKNSSNLSSVVAVAGLAGDTVEVGEMPKPEQGRVALLKAIHNRSMDDWDVRLRARLSTCRVDETSYGSPGVSICRFRPIDGRLFAIGGWDHRVRLFERSQGRAMAILRGHQGSVNSLDWAPDALQSGLLASAGADENRIYLWQCFSKDEIN
jgi:WD40 repeat protein